MDIEIGFPGGKRIDASFEGFVVHTDQPVGSGGTATAPGPFELFLASIGTCAGIYVAGFCEARGLSMEGIALREHVQIDDVSHLATEITLELTLPATFPEKYRTAVVRAAENCKVKKSIAAAPTISVRVQQEGDVSHV